MGFGKMKDAWPVWVLVIAGVVVIVLAVGQNKIEKEAVTFQDIFTEEKPASAKSAASMVDPVQSPAIVANSDSGFKVSYAVQLYSFREKSRADIMLNTLKTQGLPVYIQMSDLGDKGTWYRVRVGSYATAEEAKQILEQIKKEHKDSILVKEKK